MASLATKCQVLNLRVGRSRDQVLQKGPLVANNTIWNIPTCHKGGFALQHHLLLSGLLSTLVKCYFVTCQFELKCITRSIKSSKSVGFHPNYPFSVWTYGSNSEKRGMLYKSSQQKKSRTPWLNSSCQSSMPKWHAHSQGLFPTLFLSLLGGRGREKALEMKQIKN